MIIENNGEIASAKFDKNELDSVYTDLGISRKFLRDVLLGNTEATYTGWTHVQAESGYSIWKYAPANYTYNALNELYFNSKLLVNKGLATSETAVAFDTAYLYNGSTYTAITTEAGTELGTPFNLMTAVNNYLYVGSASKFYGVKFEFATKGSNYDLKVEYYNGSSWVELTDSGFALTDNTLDFLSDGSIIWNSVIDTNWATVAVNSVTKYWIRISTTLVPSVTATAYYIIPNASVVGLLALSSAQVLKEEWAWCTYGTSVYVTVRNIGNSYVEGSYYIATSSSTNNKKNFWVYNNVVSSNYQTSAYVASTMPRIATGTAAPATTPSRIGDVFVDTTNHKIYIADGVASSTNWRILN
jgi:hypothetical protein